MELIILAKCRGDAMLNIGNKYPQILNEQMVDSDDIGLLHIGGTSVLGAKKPVTKLEPVSDDLDEISLLKFKKELSLDISEKLIEPLEPINKDNQESDSYDPYNSKLGEFINKFVLDENEE